MNLGHLLKEERKKQNLTQLQVAEKLYVSRQTISNWENERSYPDIESLVSLSKLYNVSLDYLVREEEEILNYYHKQRKKQLYFRWCYFLNLFLSLLTLAVDYYFDGIHFFISLIHLLLFVNLILLLLFRNQISIRPIPLSKKNIFIFILLNIGFIFVFLAINYVENPTYSIAEYKELGFRLGQYYFTSVKVLSLLCLCFYPRHNSLQKKNTLPFS